MDTELLPDANRLNVRIKNYLYYINNDLLQSPSITSKLYDDIRNTLIEYLEEIDEYLESVRQYGDNSPRNDRLTKEGVLADLYTNIEEIRKVLTYIRDSIDDGSLTITEEESGGKRKNKNKKSRKTKKGKKTNKKAKSKRRR
jgi:hypothetical protein